MDALLRRGIAVRGATRSLQKGQLMIESRPQHRGSLEFVEIGDFANPRGLIEAVDGVDAIIHTASGSTTRLARIEGELTNKPFTYDTKDNEKELISPAIN